MTDPTDIAASLSEALDKVRVLAEMVLAEAPAEAESWTAFMGCDRYSAVTFTMNELRALSALSVRDLLREKG